MSDVEYELRISRIFTAPCAAVSGAFADNARLTAWSGPTGMRWAPVSRREDVDRIQGEGPLPGLPVIGAQPGMLRVEFHDEPGGKTRLELRQGPFTEAQEAVARAWWDRAFGRRMKCWQPALLLMRGDERRS